MAALHQLPSLPGSEAARHPQPTSRAHLQLLLEPRDAAQRHKQLLRAPQLRGVAAGVQVGVQRLQLSGLREVGLQLTQQRDLRAGANGGDFVRPASTSGVTHDNILNADKCIMAGRT
jgi:hypothetical protein